MKQIYITDLSKDKSKISEYISETLISKINESLKLWKKIILYINKRWTYNMLVCQDCSNVEKCPRCDIILSVHEKSEKLLCHHCSYSKEIPLFCEKCSGINLKRIWVWTQLIEEKIKILFPTSNIFRMDSDNIKNVVEKKEALENIKNADIVIWTKMITTGFDFRDIWVIGIILLEQELQIPNYNTEEKIYSNIKQLIWRWWRVWDETDIIIQTFAPKNEMIKSIVELNYKDFFKKTLEERKIFNYPPFSEIATLRYKNKYEWNTLRYLMELKHKLESFNDWSYEIILNKNTFKRNNQFFAQIIIKWKDIRNLLENIKKDIFEEKDLAVIF